MNEHSLIKKNEFGLALGGGGARGVAHIGVLRALEDVGVKPDYLSGTSMGGIIAAGYAAGMSTYQLEEVVLEFAKFRTMMKLADPTLPRSGLFQGNKLLDFMEQYLSSKKFADLLIPLTLVAVDLNSGREVHLRDGSVAEALRATISVPGLLSPVERGGMKLVDGGLLNNLPVDVLSEMGADVTLAVDVSSSPEQTSYWQEVGQRRFLTQTVGELIAVLGDSMDLLVKEVRRYKLIESPPDYLIQPAIPLDITVVRGYDRSEELIKLGYQAARTIVAELALKLDHP